MREMKDSGNMWIGATSETWKMIPLKYLASYNDEVLSENTDDEFEFDYIEIGSVQYGRGIIYTEHMKFKNAPSRARRIVRKDDIIVSTVRTYLKAVATIPACNNLLIASTGFIVIRPHKVLPRFMNYALLSESFISLVESHSTGISYPAINSVDVVKFKIPVPCRSEQERIAAFLDAECAEIDTVLEKTRASIEEYKKLKQAVITQAVTKGIRGDRPMKDSGIEWIGDIPAEWEIKRIKNICSLKTGSTPSTGNAEWFNGDLLWFTPGDFNEKFVLLSSNRTLSRTAEKDGVATMIPANSVLVVCIGGSAGKVGYTNYRCSCNQQITALCKSNIMPKLLMYDVNAGMPFLRNTTMFTTLPILNNQAIGGLVLPIPREEEQLSIIEYLDEKCAGIDALIAKKQQYLTEIENYKKSLIYEYVTGKKEVKTSVLAD